jgi:chromosome partitioning protein
LIDIDPQGNATMGSGVEKNQLSLSAYEWLVEGAGLKEVLRTKDTKYDILPSNIDLTAAEVGLLGMESREYVMRGLLSGAAYDYILIDCPPSLNILTVNALTAANTVLIPMQCEYYALEGLSALLETIKALRASSNPQLDIEGLLRTMYDPRISLSRDVSRQLVMHFGEKLFRTVIPRNIKLAEAPSHGRPVIDYDPSSKGSRAYMALGAELLKRQGGLSGNLL